MNQQPQGQQSGRAVASPPQGSMAQPGSGEILFEGTAAHSASLLRYGKWTLVSIVAGALAIGINSMDWGLPGWGLALLWLAGVPGLLWTYLTVISTKYKVSQRRIETEEGVLAKKVETLELWRVLDVEYSQSLLDRMLKNGRVKLISTDQTNPQLLLHGLPNHRQLFEQLRDAVQSARQTNRPMELVPGVGMGHDMAHDLGGHDGNLLT
jgi:membrane protein YdbS with pleckstrin-like domain